MKLTLALIIGGFFLISCGKKESDNKTLTKDPNATKEKPVLTQSDSLLRQKIYGILNLYRAQTGVAIMDLQTGDTMTFFNERKYPMQSVFKFPLGMAVLDKIDKGEMKLDQKIHIEKKDLMEDTHSPLRDTFPNGNVDVPVSELIDLTVSLSDNNSCDILFREMGGPAKVDEYIKSLGVKEMSIVADEKAMHKDPMIQFDNWSSPYGMLQLLEIIDKGNKLSKTSNDFLLKIMTASPTGMKRIKGLLPEGTAVAHKTGSSGRNSNNISEATNDAGIVTLPDGKKFAIVVFVSRSPESDEVNENIIAQVSKTAYDHFVEKYK